MNAVKFVAWWWGDLDIVERCAVLFATGMVTSLIAGMILGPVFLLYAMSAGMAILLCVLAYIPFMLVKERWARYTEYVEHQEQECVDKLRGKMHNK